MQHNVPVANDRGWNFLWMLLDMQSVEEFAQIRETSFPSNPRTFISSRRYDPVSRIAISGGDGDASIQLYRQRDAWPTSTAVEDMGVEGWDLNIASVEDAFEKWYTLAETIPVDSSRVLLAGLPAVKGLLNKMRDLDQRKGDDDLDLSVPAEHILYIYRSLKWCHDNYHNLMENVPSRAIAGDDCYGRGENKK